MRLQDLPRPGAKTGAGTAEQPCMLRQTPGSSSEHRITALDIARRFKSQAAHTLWQEAFDDFESERDAAAELS